MSEILRSHLGGWVDDQWSKTKEKKSTLATKKQYEKINKNI